MQEIGRRFVRIAGRHFRVTLPLVSILDGRAISRWFRKEHGDVQIEDLWRDTAITSGNISQSRLEIHRSGPLWRAVRASMAMPAVFPPVVQDGDLLVDAASLNDLPTDVMKAHLRGGFVIASDCRLRQEVRRFDIADNFSPWTAALRRLTPFGRRMSVPTLVEVAFLSSTIRARQHVARQRANTDLLIDVETEGYTLFGHKHIDALIALGYETAQRTLEAWGGVIDPER